MTGRAGNRPPRRVAVTSPQTRVALAGGAADRPPAPPRLTPAELERAERSAPGSCAGRSRPCSPAGAFLVGLPLLLQFAPALDHVRLVGVPLSWLAVAVLP